jgi:hypothetical protein
MWGTLEPVGSKKGSNAHALVGRLFKPVEGQAPNL